MTPPSAKPEASVSEDAATDSSADATLDAAAVAKGSLRGEGTPRATTGRRRAASLELRVARRRTLAEAEASAPRAGGAAGRVSADGSAKLGPRARARARAAKAALAGADDGAAAPPTNHAPDLTPVAEPANEAVFRSVRAAPPLAPLVLTPVAAPAAKAVVAESRPVAPADVAGADVAPADAVPVPAAAPPPVDDDDEDDRGPGSGGRRRLGPRAERRGVRTSKANDARNYVVAPTVNAAQMRPRHYGVIALFLFCVIVPTISYSWYLWTRAADQYESDVGFGSRTEEAPSTFDFFGALGGSTQSGSKDMDILNQFIISQELVAKIDADLDLKAIWSKADNDPLNGFNEDGTIEDLVTYWQRMVLVNYDNGTGLMNLRVFAFDPQDAQNIASAVLTESTNIINQLSKTAQDDTTRYSKDALAATEAKLTEARLAVLDFQVRNNIVDPSNVVANQLSVVSTLNQQLASAQIDFDMLSGTVPATDPRLAQLSRRLEVIRNRITEEQAKVGATADSNSPGFAKLMADFERLRVDQDFAQAAYLPARAAHEQALTDAQQKTRYLAAYVAPTLAEAPTAPNRPQTAALTALIGFLIWSVLVLTYYALRDRR